MTYQLVILPSAERDMARLDLPVRRRVDSRILALAEDPPPPGCLKMAGPGDLYRVRVGDYRVVYTVEDARLVVLVVRIGHRSDVYRGR